jgi:Immunoglobulin-like domain of bacterial spore germination/Sporulation and spore germination
MSPTDDDRMRQLLDDAVADVEPRRGLDDIRGRTTASRAPRPWVWGAGGAVRATAASIAAVVVFAGGPGTSDDGPGPAGSPSTVAHTPRDESTATSPFTVPVFFVGDTGAGPRLFRESHVGPPSAHDDPVLDAVQQALDGHPHDADYRTLWPAGTLVRAVTPGATEIRVDLTGDGLSQRPPSMSGDQAEISVQQLVYTVQAALRGSRLPVRFEVGGEPTPTLLGVQTGDPVAAGGQDDELAPVSISSPQERTGSSLPLRTPVTVTGHASTFEANVQWELKQGDRVVRRGFTTAGECCTLAPYSFTFTAPPGEYTLVVHDEDVSDGEGVPASRDTKDIRLN